MIYMISMGEYAQYIDIAHDKRVERIYDMSMRQFIDQWCMQYGSTSEGRRITCAKRLGIHQKIPILISERTKDILFPTRNIKDSTCVWVNYQSIDYVKKRDQHTQLYFLNGSSVTIAVDVRVVKRGMRICDEYLQILQSSPL